MSDTSIKGVRYPNPLLRIFREGAAETSDRRPFRGAQGGMYGET